MTDPTGTSAATHCPNCGEAIKHEGEHWEQGGYYCRPSSNRVECVCGHSAEDHWRGTDGCKHSCHCANFRRPSSNRVLRAFQPGYWLVSVDDAGGAFRLRITPEEYETAKAAHAIPNSVPTPAEALCGAHHPVTAMTCTKERGHEGEHQSKHGNPWPTNATPNRVTDDQVEAAAQACADYTKLHVNSIDRDLMRTILEAAT